jgi:PPK2 family polyphosphate:nucleotide phosphotransferase
MKARDLRLVADHRFAWQDHDPRAKCGFRDRADAEARLAEDVTKLGAFQDVFAANGTYGLVIIIQGVDAAGKDGIIKHVMGGLNAQGVSVHSFRAPSPQERLHDFLWRANRALPERGRIAIFNRSYYEEVLTLRVNPELVQAERIPQRLIEHDLWETRFREINEFERYLQHNGIGILKFFLNISKREQLQRLLARIDEKEKNWKFSASDLETPQKWDAYQDAYAEMLRHTSTKHAPWYVIPADRKWVARLAVATIVVEHLESLQLTVPKPVPHDAERLALARAYIEAELARIDEGLPDHS